MGAPTSPFGAVGTHVAYSEEPEKLVEEFIRLAQKEESEATTPEERAAKSNELQEKEEDEGGDLIGIREDELGAPRYDLLLEQSGKLVREVWVIWIWCVDQRRTLPPNQCGTSPRLISFHSPPNHSSLELSPAFEHSVPGD